MTKVVVDTNILISSFWGGNPYKIIDLWRQGHLKLCLSPSIVEEYIAVLERMGIANEVVFQEFLQLLSSDSHVIFTINTPKLSLVNNDPDDDKFIECAVALKAKYIISGDKELYKIQNYCGIQILQPKNFLDVYKRNEELISE